MRLAKVGITPDLMVALQQGQYVVETGGVPAGAVVHDVVWDAAARVIVLVLEHQSFPESREGAVLPWVAPPVVRRVDRGEVAHATVATTTGDAGATAAPQAGGATRRPGVSTPPPDREHHGTVGGREADHLDRAARRDRGAVPGGSGGEPPEADADGCGVRSCVKHSKREEIWGVEKQALADAVLIV